MCDRPANDEQFLEWANQEKDFVEAQEKWDRVQRLHDAKLEQQTAGWCATTKASQWFLQSNRPAPGCT